MAASSAYFDSFKEYIGDGTIDLNTDPPKVALLTSSYTFNASHTVFANVSSAEISNSGYLAGGQTLTNVVWSRTGGTAKLSSDNPTWQAQGSPLVARWGIVYMAVTRNGRTNPLVMAVLLDVTPANITIATSGYLVLTVPSTGILTLS
jgi:hypothetical protein